MTSEKRVAVWLAILGSVLAAMALWFGIEKVLLLHYGVVTNGRVVGEVKEWHAKGTSYRPTIVFSDRAGNMVVFTDADTSGYPVGSFVKIVYDPRNPAHAAVRSPSEDWKAPVIIGLVAAVILSISIYRFRQAAE